jgi:hypothetical protein
MGGQRPLLGGFMMMVGVVALYRGSLRPWMYTWGAREDEVTAQLRVMSWLRRTRRGRRER